MNPSNMPPFNRRVVLAYSASIALAASATVAV